MNKPYKIRMLWGETYSEKKTYSFATEAELKAFLLGVREMDGWLGYEVDKFPQDFKTYPLTKKG